jgi:hypothetical protein
MQCYQLVEVDENPAVLRFYMKFAPEPKVGRADVFDYIEMFYNLKRRHNSSDGIRQ